jgi:hypothetical protein
VTALEGPPRRYADLAAPFREAAGRGEDPPREFYTRPPTEHRASELELIGVMTGPHRAMQLYGFDPGFDPRRALLVKTERRVSLTNYLNFAGAGTRPAAPTRGGHTRTLVLWAVGVEEAGVVDARLDVESDHVVLAHDFRVHNPAAAALRQEQAFRQHALFWLDDGTALSGMVYNLEQVLLRAEETTLFLSVCQPRFYGTMHSAVWGQGLPYVALNRRYVVAKKLAPTLEEVETHLALERGLQPPGFAPAQLQTWAQMPEAVRRAAARAGA